jgi:hypothetical protein
MAPASKNGELRGLGEPTGVLIAIDPGKRCGICIYDKQYGLFVAGVCALDELPSELHANLSDMKVQYVICEDFSLKGGVRNNDPSMPSSQGIGMCKTACDWTGTPLVLVQRTVKRAGHQALDAQGLAAYAAARNDHERDAVDIMGYALREMRR